MKKQIIALLFLFMISFIPALAEDLTSNSDSLQINLDVGSIRFTVPEGFRITSNTADDLSLENDDYAYLKVLMCDSKGYTLEECIKHIDEYVYYDSIEIRTKGIINGIELFALDYIYNYSGLDIYGDYIGTVDESDDTLYIFNYYTTRPINDADEANIHDLIQSIEAKMLSEKQRPTPLPAITPKPTIMQDNKLITFRDAPWGISFTEADQLFPEYRLSSAYAGENMRVYPIEEIVTDKSEHDYEYSDINIPAYCFEHEFQVAGYTTSGIYLYFAYTPVDGILTHKEEDTALYAAKYEFEPANIDFVADDLTRKLSSVYGEPDKDGARSSYSFNYTWTLWWGTDHTAVALTKKIPSQSSSNGEIWISYYTTDGFDWLQTASDAEKERLLRLENAAAESGDTSGL